MVRVPICVAASAQFPRPLRISPEMSSSSSSAPQSGENMGCECCSCRELHHYSRASTHDDLVVVPCLVSLHLLALAKAARTQVDLFALLRRTLDPDSMRDIDSTWSLTLSGRGGTTQQLTGITGVLDTRLDRCCQLCTSKGICRLTQRRVSLAWLSANPPLRDRHVATSFPPSRLVWGGRCTRSRLCLTRRRAGRASRGVRDEPARCS